MAILRGFLSSCSLCECDLCGEFFRGTISNRLWLVLDDALGSPKNGVHFINACPGCYEKDQGRSFYDESPNRWGDFEFVYSKARVFLFQERIDVEL